MNILVIAPHPDDEVLGVGGTIAKHAAAGDDVYVCVVTHGAEPLFRMEDTEYGRQECRKADKMLGVKETIFLKDFPAAMLEEVPRYKLNDALLQVVKRTRPDTVYIPHRGDMQLDHKMIVDAMMVAVRPKYDFAPREVLMYETLSETGWDVPNTTNEFIPNVYEDISDYLKQKLDALSSFESQLAPFPAARSIEAIEALAKYRGALMGMKAAEAFTLVRSLRRKGLHQ